MDNPAPNHPPTHVLLGRRLFSPPTVISLIAVISLVIFLALRLDIAWSETWRVIRDINPFLYLLAVFIHYLTFLFRSARWRLLLINAAHGQDATFTAPSLKYSSSLILMSFFANAVTWFHMGDAFRAYAYAEDTRSSFPSSMGTVLADRAIDLIIIVGLMAVAAGVLYASGDVRPSVQFLLLGTGFLAAFVVGLITMLLLQRWVAPRLPSPIGRVYGRFHTGTMGSFGRMHWVFSLSVLAWLCAVGRLFFVLKALDTQVTAGLVIFVPLANVLLSAVPLTPGGLGIVETGITGLLQLQLTIELALAVALVDRTISYLSIILTGGAAFAVRQVMIARRSSAADMEESGVVQHHDCR